MKRKVPLIPVLLLGLALADLQSELRLLLDHFTFTTLMVAIQNHLLAVTVLALLPSLWKLYRGHQA
ncbi:MAG: hypothetical protein VKN83_00445 [Cyanobacteriota bacterium]|nr:hypothetical protein [Cyanobacteriota bacterium]